MDFRKHIQLTGLKTVFILLLAGVVSATESWVSDPYRGLEVTWPIPAPGDGGCTILLEPIWHKLKGVSELPFVKTSGTALKSRPSMTGNAYFLRTMVLKELTGYSSDGRRVPLTVEIQKTGDSELLILHPEHLTDGRKDTTTVLSGSLENIRERFAPLKVRLMIRAETPVARIDLASGFWQGCDVELMNGIPTDSLALKIPEKNFSLELTARALRYGDWKIAPEIRKRLEKYPFVLIPWLRFSSRNLLGLHPENIDRMAWKNFEQKYAGTFLGYLQAEWDSNFFQTLIRPASLRYGDLLPYIDFPCGRDGMVRNMKTFWDYHKSVFGKNIMSLSGQVLFPHYAAEWGGRLAGFELTQERSEHPHRNSLMFTRGAARQFNIPMLVYQAYYAINYTADSRFYRKAMGLDYGMAPSIGFRTFMTGYYMGNSFMDFECQPWGQVKKNKDGTHSLTANGKAIEKFYDWIHSPAGERGTAYTPFLLLLDRKHGHDCWERISPYWGVWYGQAPLTDADYMTEYVLQAVSPRYRKRQYDNPDKPANLRNSSLGDLFDVYLANPLTRGQVKLQQLEPYPVVMLVDDIAYTGKLIANLRNYVKRGGTLVMTAGHLKPFRKDFTGLTGTGRPRIRQDGLVLEQFQASEDTEVLMKTSGGLPLVYSHPYGGGRVLTITAPFMKKTDDITMIPPQLKKLLDKLQSDVCPVKVSGDIHYLYNLMPDGSWKVILLNNRGTAKAPDESTEHFFPEYAAEVRITAPPGAQAVETRLNVPVQRREKVIPVNPEEIHLGITQDFEQREENGHVEFTVTVPAGEVLVLDVTGVPAGSRRILPAVPLDPAPADPPLPPDPPVKGRKMPDFKETPSVIGQWKASENYAGMKCSKVSFRNGRAIFSQPRNYAQTEFKAPYPCEAGSFEITALPHELGDRRQGVVYFSHNLMVELRKGHWGVYHYSNGIFQFLQGPRAEQRLTHLKVTWAKGFIHFFVDGKEVHGPAGPLKYFDNPIKDTFYGRITVALGSLSPSWPKIFAFNGELGDFMIRGGKNLP